MGALKPKAISKVALISATFGNHWGVSGSSTAAKDLVSQGGLRADQLTRTLVPALLAKADKIARGKVSRTGSSDVAEAGLED